MKKRPRAGNVGGCWFADLKIYWINTVSSYCMRCMRIYTNNLEYLDIMFPKTWKGLPIAIGTM